MNHSHTTRDTHWQLLIEESDQLRRAGKLLEAAASLEQLAAAEENPPASICLKLAQIYQAAGQDDDACRWAVAVTDQTDAFTAWYGAAGVWRSCHGRAATRRSARAALVGSYNTNQLAQLLPLAAARFGIRLELFEGPYGQYRQELLNAASATYAFAPQLLIMAVHEGELAFSDGVTAPEQEVERELYRWTGLWEAARSHSTARLIQHNFAIPGEVPWGHLAAKTTSSRYHMAQQLNLLLGERAGDDVSLVDCERLAAWIGKSHWFDPRYWHLSKQAVALSAVPLLARHTAAVLAADLGLSRKCIVLDLDNTLWGGVIGEDGLSGIRLGNHPDGEAFLAFQDYLLRLKDKGILLAVCSKNNEADARLPFEQHPDMRLRLEDFAVFVANWEAKSDNLRHIAQSLDLGLDALVFIDDNPVERAVVRRWTPEVDVIALPADPARYIAALAQYGGLETASLTTEDRQRTQQYRARAQATALKGSAESVEDFQRQLQMEAIVAPFDELHLPRIVQLIGKTNQFNLTTHRPNQAEVDRVMRDPNCIHRYLRLRDRFADHGLVSAVIGVIEDDVLEIVTWVMSCRVIGRTVEATVMEQLGLAALERGCVALRGKYTPTPKNAPAKEVYGQLGFRRVREENDTVIWSYDLVTQPPLQNDVIQVITNWELPHEPSSARGRSVSVRVS